MSRATERELMAARIFMRAVFPVMKVVLNDDLKMKKKFENVEAVVQFKALDKGGDVGAYLVFNKGELTIEQGFYNKPDIIFNFNSVKKMNAMLAGKPVLPRITGLSKFGLLIKILGLLMSLKIMMPNVKPKKYEKKKLKVKMAFYMITTALSQYNKGGDPEMVKWTTKQPERVYQMSVEGEEIAAYLKIKAGKSKGGRGMYTRKRPFVHMKFNGVDGALAVLLKEVEFVEAVGREYVAIEGAPEYGAQVNDFMMRIQTMIT